MHLSHKLVTTRQRPSVFGLSYRTGPAISCEHWQQVPFLFLSLSLAPSTPLTALHSNSDVCEWVCVGAVVLIGEVSKHLGGLYNNCDKVESLFLIVVQSCRVIFLLQQSVGGFMLCVHPKLFYFLFLRKVTLASSAFHLSLSVAIALWKQITFRQPHTFHMLYLFSGASRWKWKSACRYLAQRQMPSSRCLL